MNDQDRQHLDQLKAAVDPQRVAEALGLQHRGRRFFCPACQPDGGKSPDLSTVGNGFFCYKCGTAGDVLQLVQLAGGMDFPAAVAWLESFTGLVPPPWKPSRGRRGPTPPRPAGARQDAPRTPPGAATRAPDPGPCPDAPAALQAFLDACGPPEGAALDWLVKERGIAPEVVEACRLRFCGRDYLDVIEQLKDRFAEDVLEAAGLLKRSKKGDGLVPAFWHYFAAKAGFLVVPYFRGGSAVFLKVRPPCGKAKAEALGLVRFLNTAGTIPCLYNVDALSAAPPPDRVLICEGESDTWAALSAGFAAVGSPGARQFKAAWVEDFRQLVTPGGRSRVYLAADGDAAGRAGARIVADLFLRAGLPVPLQLAIPEGLDLAEYLKGE